MAYAENTSVPVERSRAEIEKNILQTGGSKFQLGLDDDRAIVLFRSHDRLIKFTLPLPAKESFRTYESRGKTKERTPIQQHACWEQACRQKWRALNLAIRAKLECVESGISEFEDEFLANVVDPASGKTIGEVIRPEIKQRYMESPGKVTRLRLPSPMGRDD